jgi:hypothetical protein
MEAITQHSITRAADDAVKLWALASAQYPRQHGLILDVATNAIIEAASSFALNARRALEVLPPSKKFRLTTPRWEWAPSNGGEVVSDLRDALNRIIHAQKLQIGLEELPKQLGVIVGGACVVPYIRAQTHQKTLAFIDPFALAYAFLYDVFPELVALKQNLPPERMH